MSVRLKDLDPAARKRVEQSAARGGPPSPTGSPRRKKTEGLEVRCYRCGADCSSESSQARHTKEQGHHRYQAVLG